MREHWQRCIDSVCFSRCRRARCRTARARRARGAASTAPSRWGRTAAAARRGGRVGRARRRGGKAAGEWVVMARRRNNSSSEAAAGECEAAPARRPRAHTHSQRTLDGGSSLLCNPSAALQRLVPAVEHPAVVGVSPAGAAVVVAGGGGSATAPAPAPAGAPLAAHAGLDLLSRPVMAFVLQQHPLEALGLTMRQALRKATCRVFAMQALNWLLRNVTQPASLHDLLWWFVAALTPAPELYSVCEHPLSDISIAGEAVHPLPATFHALLQTVADLMLLLPAGSALQQMAVRCWGLRFSPADHMFLHRSQVFSNISKILSRSEEEADELSASLHESHQSTYSQATSCVECLKDLTAGVEMKASSRQAMVGSLVDNSTETFWESGDEDRNKTKTITIVCGPGAYPRMVYIHIDNCRDLANKVSSVTFQSGPNPDELYRLRQVEVENRATGWISCPVLDARHAALRLELKGPDNSLRLRQVRVLGEQEGESLKAGRQHSALTIQQRNCEAETLRVFRLITSQPEEGREADEGKGEPEESHDLKEHMVGILFSRSKLTHLQRQVCVHIVQAIRKEAARVRDEWEALLCSGQAAASASASSLNGNGASASANANANANGSASASASASALGGGAGAGVGALEGCKQADTYCFEMLSMVLALSGSAVGRAYLAHQHALLRDLLSLLHTGSARVQRQVGGPPFAAFVQ
ncbi:Putative inhibitor of type v adenylyl cyclase/neuronal presynaptic protein highwire/pam/rpm-1, partial [Gryllus bimaculatus]